MERRDFLKRSGLLTAGAFTLNSAGGTEKTKNLPSYRYPEPGPFEALRDADGLWVLRLAVRSRMPVNPDSVLASIRISNGGSIDRMRHDVFLSNQLRAIRKGEKKPLHPEERNLHVIVVWIRDAHTDSVVHLEVLSGSIDVPLGELHGKQDLYLSGVHAKFLLDHEIGRVNPRAMGIREPNGNPFSFIASADPQGGNPWVHEKTPTRMRIHNAFIDETVSLINRIKADPSFVVMIGDITDGWGEGPDFVAMNRALSKIDAPLLYTIGNHESPHDQTFDPGYRMEDYHNYLAAQREINGLEMLLYSFDLGDWHFVFWPDPLRDGFWENHTHYFDWLERDLEANKNRPTMIFQHVPTHPIGIDPLIWYCEAPEVKNTFLDIASRHGNVKLILSGHVHIPVKASFKTAVEYRGMQMINLPAAGYRPRAFGEPDSCDGPPQGAAIVEINGPEFQVTYKTVTEAEYPYPKKLRTFDTESFATWLTPKYALPASRSFRNPNFKQGLAGWVRNWVYLEDKDPSNRCEVRPAREGSERPYLHMMTRKRGFEAPGQDRLPQSINQVTQAIDITGNPNPKISLDYRMPSADCDLGDICGAFIWVEGFRGRTKYLNIAYGAHWMWANFEDKHSDPSEAMLKLALPMHTDRWTALELTPLADWEHARQMNSERRSKAGDLDRLCLSIGLWTINQGERGQFVFEVRQFRVDTADSDARSTANQAALGSVSEDRVWWRNKLLPNKNLSGEHRYHLPMETRF